MLASRRQTHALLAAALVEPRAPLAPAAPCQRTPDAPRRRRPPTRPARGRSPAPVPAPTRCAGARRGGCPSPPTGPTIVLDGVAARRPAPAGRRPDRGHRRSAPPSGPTRPTSTWSSPATGSTSPASTRPPAPLRRPRPRTQPRRCADDPAEPGPYDVVTSDYELDPVKLPRMREPIEMVGHVVEPAPAADTGPRPLVLFLHGRHSVLLRPDRRRTPTVASGRASRRCEEIPSHLGYDYIQQVLASQGYATVSVRVNGINAQDYRLADGGADARAEIVQRHLDHWADARGRPPGRPVAGWCSSATAAAARASTAPRSRSRSTRRTASSARCCSRRPTSAPRPRRTSRP